MVQPNTSRAQTFAEAFITSGGIETLLVLLQREAKAGDHSISEPVTKSYENLSVDDTKLEGISKPLDGSQDNEVGSQKERDSQEKLFEPQSPSIGGSPAAVPTGTGISRMSSVSENPFLKNLGGINLSISAENARNNVYNIDKSDGVVVAIIGLVGALITSGHLKFGSQAPSDVTGNLAGINLHERGGTMFDDKVSLLLFALQKALQAAPNRLMTSNVYTALLGASVGIKFLFLFSVVLCVVLFLVSISHATKVVFFYSRNTPSHLFYIPFICGGLVDLTSKLLYCLGLLLVPL